VEITPCERLETSNRYIFVVDYTIHLQLFSISLAGFLENLRNNEKHGNHYQVRFGNIQMDFII